MKDFMKNFIYAVWHALKDVAVFVSIVFDLVMLSIVWVVKSVVNFIFKVIDFIFKVIDFISFWVGYYIFRIKSGLVMRLRGVLAAVFHDVFYEATHRNGKKYVEMKMEGNMDRIHRHKVRNLKRGLRKYGEGYIIMLQKSILEEVITISKYSGETMEGKGNRVLENNYNRILELEKRYEERKKKLGFWKRLIKRIKRQFLYMDIK